MIVNYECEVSEQSNRVLVSLQNAVTGVLTKKRRLGQYAVVWDSTTTSPKYINSVNEPSPNYEIDEREN